MKYFVNIFGLIVLAALFSCSKTSTPNPTGLSDEKNILSLSILGEAGIIDQANNLIEVNLPSAISVNSLTPQIVVSSKASVSPASGVAMDFTVPVNYTVTAENGSIKVYTVVVIPGSLNPSDEKAMLSFIINGKSASINEGAKTVNLELPAGTDLTSLSPVISISPKATVSPASTAAVNFTNPVSYTVAAENGNLATYYVTVTAKKSSEKSILEFDLIKANLSNYTYTSTPDTVVGAINQSNKVIQFYAQENATTNLAAIKPFIRVSPKATITPGSMVPKDFNIPVTYTVTAEDGSTAQYTVKFEKAKFIYSSSSFLAMPVYIVPDKTSVAVGEEIMLTIAGAGHYGLLVRGVSWSRPANPGTLVSGSGIRRVTADGTQSYFRFAEPGTYKIWLNIEDYIEGATRQVLSNQYNITVY